MSRRLILEADGGSRGNPGVAGYGALLQDPATGELLAERAAPLGKESNNVAEYRGLIAGLEAVLDLGLATDARVAVRMDSKLVIEQMAGRWKIKHEGMRRLALQARELVQSIQRSGGSVSWEWIPRAENKAADALSNDGMDGETIVRNHVAPAAASDKPASSQPASQAAAEHTQGTLFGESSTPVAEVAMAAKEASLTGQTRIYLVRHGVSQFTIEGRLDGRGGSNPPLARPGLEQAAAVGQAMKERLERDEVSDAEVITSTLRRAQQTGGAIADAIGVTPQVDADWDEQAFGDWDGLSMEELATKDKNDLMRLRSDLDFARPGGESHRQLAQRVSQALQRAVARGGTVVVASHRKPILCVLSEILGLDHEKVWALATEPASITALDVWPDGGARIAFVNDTHHLKSLPPTASKF